MPRSHQSWRTLVLCCLALCAGCQTVQMKPPAKYHFFESPSAKKSVEERQHRQQWQAHRDGKALRWLLQEVIHNGLTLAEVNDRLGDTGVAEDQTQAFKTKADGYLMDDKLYRYGPDKEGQTYYLAFRDGKVVNFDPHEVK